MNFVTETSIKTPSVLIDSNPVVRPSDVDGSGDTRPHAVPGVRIDDTWIDVSPAGLADAPVN